MTAFADQLASRIFAHPEFWSEFRAIRAMGARGSMHKTDFARDQSLEDDSVNRLVYCASIFAQGREERTLALAQSIALSALFVEQSDSHYGADLPPVAVPPVTGRARG